MFVWIDKACAPRRPLSHRRGDAAAGRPDLNRQRSTSKSHGYNFSVFPPNDDCEAFAVWPEFLKAGHRAPDPQLLDLNSGAMVRLTEVTRDGLTVVELGSLT